VTTTNRHHKVGGGGAGILPPSSSNDEDFEDELDDVVLDRMYKAPSAKKVMIDKEEREM
jgi:hypothetical protein